MTNVGSSRSKLKTRYVAGSSTMSRMNSTPLWSRLQRRIARQATKVDHNLCLARLQEAWQVLASHPRRLCQSIPWLLCRTTVSLNQLQHYLLRSFWETPWTRNSSWIAKWPRSTTSSSFQPACMKTRWRIKKVTRKRRKTCVTKKARKRRRSLRFAKLNHNNWTSR